MSPRRFLLLLTAAAAAWTLFELIWHATGAPAPLIDYASRSTDLVMSHQPPGDDGWPLLIEAAEIVGRIDVETRAAWEKQETDQAWVRPDYTRLREEPFDESACRWEIEALERMRREGVFELLARAAASPRMVRPLVADTALLIYPLPNLARFRGLARIRQGMMRLAAHRGDEQEVVRAFEETLALSRACLGQAFLIDRLVGYAIHGMAVNELRVELLDHRFDEATLRDLVGALERQSGAIPPVEIVVETERFLGLDVIQRSFSDDGHGDGRLGGDKLAEYGRLTAAGSSPLDGLGGLVLAPRAETTRVFNAFYDGLVENCRLPAADRLAGRGFDPGVFLSGLSFRHHLLKTLASATGRALEYEDAMTVTNAGLRTMLAIEAYRARHGALPASLAELAGSFLPAVPKDPSTGQPFIYRPLPAASVTGGGWDYLLYSMGADGIDDTAGEDPGNAESIATFSRGVLDEGYDLPITVPRGELK